MKTKSAKGKGRRLQNLIRSYLIFWLCLTDEDVTTAIMGEKGADVKIVLSKRFMFNYKIECKSQKEGFSAVYKAYQQCINHPGDEEPLLIIKQDRQKPLAIIDAEYFIKLHDRRTHDR